MIYEYFVFSSLSLFSSYPTRYIYNQFKKRFTKYSITSTSIISMIHDENELFLIRRQLLDQASVGDEHRRAARIAQTFDYDNFPPNIDPLVKAKLLKRRERANSIFVHYTHEKRFQHYGKTIHQIWNDTFHNAPIETTKLIVATRNNPNLTQELVRRNPFTKNSNIQK